MAAIETFREGDIERDRPGSLYSQRKNHLETEFFRKLLERESDINENKIALFQAHERNLKQFHKNEMIRRDVGLCLHFRQVIPFHITCFSRSAISSRLTMQKHLLQK
jgi:hypothetical protein